MEDRILTIRGKVSRSKRSGMISEEFFLGSYFRQFRLSDEVDQSKIKASLDQGALTIDLPKAEKAKPKRIDVELDELYFRVTRQDRSCYAAFTW